MALDADALAKLAALAGHSVQAQESGEADSGGVHADDEGEARLRDVVSAAVRERIDSGAHADDEGALDDGLRLVEDLDCDDITLWSIIAAVERETKTTLPDERVRACRTVGDLVELVRGCAPSA